MSKDDPRMHGGDTPGLVPGRGHERFEEEVRLDHPEPGADQPGTTGGDAGRTDDADTSEAGPPSALGGHTATTSGGKQTPADEREG